ncbi:hypothetical protein Acid345_3386 [Candidatus Koribacter versatilis Ellin345]|uniref:Uncharacterized protein n=1 Tax=Koribacter versatilis (strain Ellin345) TaxID=204669 RepID=Q1IL63_KORVE|nr:hypothetical protein [Candidatus Koribacter versatilis]ABF42387.1 hypothetical protein Acid345_3386 [Candidatus Koribacter versatilis Ellin345]
MSAAMPVVPTTDFNLADQVEQYIDAMDLIHAISSFHPESVGLIAELEEGKAEIRARIHRHVAAFGEVDIARIFSRSLVAGRWRVFVRLDEPGDAIYMVQISRK